VTSKFHDEELDIDVELVRRLVATQFAHWSELEIEAVDSSGTSNAMFRLGDELAVRLPRVEWTRSGLDLEREWLPVLAQQLPVAVPEPVAAGEPGEGYPWRWAVCRWCEGEIPRPGRAGVEAARDLARFVRALRAVDRTGAPRSSNRGAPLSARDWMRPAAEDLRGEFDVAADLSAWEAALAAPDWDGDPVWLHGDLLPANLLVDGDRLTAVLDFGCLTLGDPACDVMAAWTVFSGEPRAAFRDALDVDDATWTRSKGWALSFAVAALPYYRETNPVICETARHAIAEVLADG
jgi:aminoglycoside phosphotransferase (APT) family kinase protein